MGRKLANINVGGKSFLGQQIEQALERSHVTKSTRPQKLSPSMFPVCSVIQRMQWSMYGHLGYLYREEGCALSIFAKAGTGMHETMQFYLGFGGKLWGNWKCVNRGCSKAAEARSVYENGKRIKKGKLTRSYSTVNTCPECGSPMEYVELKIMWKLMKGFVDAVFEMPDGTYWVVDFKSASVKKIDGGTYFDKKHAKQLGAYAWVLANKYKLNISGYSLFYLPRDNPRNFAEHPVKWTAKQNENVGADVKANHHRYKQAKTDWRLGTFDKSFKAKPCSTPSEYYSKIHGYDECPMLDYCFKKDTCIQAMEAWDKACASKKIPEGVPFREAVKLVTDKEFKRRRGLGVDKDKPKGRRAIPAHISI